MTHLLVLLFYMIVAGCAGSDGSEPAQAQPMPTPTAATEPDPCLAKMETAMKTMEQFILYVQITKVDVSFQTPVQNAWWMYCLDNRFDPSCTADQARIDQRASDYLAALHNWAVAKQDCWK